MLATAFVLGVAAAGLWLRRRGAQQPALPERAGIEPPPVPPPPAARPGRFARAGTGRFQRGAIDIVTVVDDLLGASR
jgi:hypothetical protein